MQKVFLILFLFLSAHTFAQVDVNWKTPVEGSAKSIYFHQFTLTPVVETSSFYYGVNSIDKTVLWSIKKSDKMAALQALRTASALAASSDMTAGMDLAEYYEIPNTQFASISNNIIDVSTGKILIGEGVNPFKSLLSNDIIPELNLLLVKVKDEDGSQKLYAIDLKSSEVIWSTKLAEANTGKDVLNFVAKANGWDKFTINLFQPVSTASGDIIYNINSKLLLINGKTGAITWENECNPGTFFLNHDQSTIVVIDKPGMISLGTPKPFGKKVMAIDAVTGKNLWTEATKLDGAYKTHSFLSDYEVLLANNDGLNLYDIKTGKKIWKKDYEANNLKTMNATTEGLELQFGNKLIVIDAKTGKKIWKKAIELEGLDEKAEYDVFRKDYKDTRIIMTPGDIYVFDKASGKKKWSKGFDDEAKVAFDDANHKILIISKKKIFLFNPDEQKKAPKPIEIKIENSKEIEGYVIKGSNYFIYGQKEFLLIDKDGKMIDHKVYKQLAGDRLKKAMLIVSSIVSSAMSTTVTVGQEGGPQREYGVFVDPAKAAAFAASAEVQENMLRNIKANDKQRRAVRTDDNYAYFLKGENKGGGNIVISLVVVEKSTGKETKTIDFSKNRDVVYELDINNNMLYFIDNASFNMITL